MTYAPPEGVTIGTVTADALPATFRAPVGAGFSYKIYGTAAGVGTATSEGEPEGYKIPILNTSGVTENLAPFIDEWGNGYVSSNGAISNAGEETQERYSPQIAIEPNVTYQWAYQTGTFPESSTKTPWSGIGWYNDDGFISRSAGTVRGTLEVVSPANAKYAILSFRSFGENYNAMFIKSQTPPDHYIPHRYESNYDLFIGNTKLYEDEYLDFVEQKIYKLQEGELTPTDPPHPLPSIITYDGENTLSSTETLGEVEFTGDWLAIMGSTQAESIDIEFTVDAEEYIAFVTVDDGPSIQVSDTITMPSSADSFTLEVVSWGREQYTDTVYNALS